MKRATLPSLQDDRALEETVDNRLAQDEFIARGLRSAEEAKRTGIYHDAADVHDELQRRLDDRRKRVLSGES